MSGFSRTGSTRGRTIARWLVGAVLSSAACGEEKIGGPTAAEFSPTLAATASAPLSFRQVSGADYGSYGHACGVTSDDVAYCWGHNFSGELGIGTGQGPEECYSYPCSTRPVAVKDGLRFRHVVAGVRYSCGVTTDYRAFCWGRNYEGQLGNSSFIDGTTTPIQVSGGHQFRQIRAGNGHTCGITRTNVAYCWGWNDRGQLGDGTTSQRMTPVKVAGTQSWLQLNVGYAHTCGITTTNKAYCWGANSSGALGDGTTTNRSKPTAVMGGLSFQQIDGEWAHSCGVTTGGRAYCWGLNSSGQLGDSTRTNRLRPTLVFGLRYYDHVSLGTSHTCAVTRAGKGYCWGAGWLGQLGTGRTIPRVIPTPLGVTLTLLQVGAGGNFTCGVTTERKAYCWGLNDNGQIGDGTTTMRLLPVPVAGPA